jgi:hypothetical protein
LYGFFQYSESCSNYRERHGQQSCPACVELVITMHKMSFEVKRQDSANSPNARLWPSALLIAIAAVLAWALEPALIHLLMR